MTNVVPEIPAHRSAARSISTSYRSIRAFGLQEPHGHELLSYYAHTSRVHHQVPWQWFKLITVPARRGSLGFHNARPVDLEFTVRRSQSVISSMCKSFVSRFGGTSLRVVRETRSACVDVRVSGLFGVGSRTLFVNRHFREGIIWPASPLKGMYVSYCYRSLSLCRINDFVCLIKASSAFGILMLQAPWCLVHVCLIFILMVIDLGVTSLEI